MIVNRVASYQEIRGTYQQNPRPYLLHIYNQNAERVREEIDERINDTNIRFHSDHAL